MSVNVYIEQSIVKEGLFYLFFFLFNFYKH